MYIFVYMYTYIYIYSTPKLGALEYTEWNLRFNGCFKNTYSIFGAGP